ncbi:MAG TPA: SRPBCC domain-containing protein [Chloroflexota bacterium]|nr:SRPBCC domain-containing protein [Chloroflexota bacterium]
MVPDQIEREILVEAPVTRVWAALTQAEHLRVWFAFAGAEVDLRPGGAILMRWKEHGTFHGRVERVDPPCLFSYRWALVAGEEPRQGNSTLVEFTLTPEGRATRLRVLERGFSTLEGTDETRAEHVAANRQGWDGGLHALQEYLAPRP